MTKDRKIIIALIGIIAILLIIPLAYKFTKQKSAHVMSKEEMKHMSHSDTMVAVLSYAEISGNSTTRFIRVAIDKNSTLAPEKIQLLGKDGESVKELPLSKASRDYICMNAMDENH